MGHSTALLAQCCTGLPGAFSRNRGLILSRAGRLLLHDIQIASEAHTASHSLGNGGLIQWAQSRQGMKLTTQVKGKQGLAAIKMQL